ncbi:hypothetical protein, partial [Exiguobacterium sp. KKBO11]|uniref:hypothetical protein n=1 Tax=Exiguobacterium sp. KKBO11 TaxID=1805000 RepID=UPI0012E8F8C6
MKNFGLSLVAAACLAGLSSPSYAKQGDVSDKVVPVTDVYVPSNFDSSSDAFVVVSGLFANSCYKVGDVKVDQVDANTQQVTTHASVTEGLCLMVMVPFHKEVQLGKLSPGDHTVRFLSGDGT